MWQAHYICIRFNQERRFNRYRHTHSNIEYQKYMKQKLTQLKEEIDSSTIVVEDFQSARS